MLSSGMLINPWDQPIGPALPNWKAPLFPPHDELRGRRCALEALNPERHARELFAALSVDEDGRSFTYLPYGPFDSFELYRAWMEEACEKNDPQLYAIMEVASRKPLGVAAYLRIQPAAGSIEVGHLWFSTAMRRTPLATEAMYLMMERAFELGYRRYEWKCDALNAPSRAAAERLGLSFEGIFRNATVYKNRSRDTAWYAAIDAEWPALQHAFMSWLDPANFDEQGVQRTRLADLTRPILKSVSAG